MDTTVQRATQKINIKLLLSEPTKIKFQKAFPSPLLRGREDEGGGRKGKFSPCKWTLF